MEREEELRKVLLSILEIGLQRIRNLGHAERPEACNEEAYHLHNVPHLVDTLSKDELLYYLDVERECYLRGKPENVEQFRVAWDRLEALVRPT